MREYYAEYRTRPYAKEAAAERQRRYRAKNRRRVADLAKAQQALRREWANSLKSMPCAHCGRKFPPQAMEWHHVNPVLKEFTIGPAVTRGMGSILEEITKCDLLCSCCHRLIEAGDYGWY